MLSMVSLWDLQAPADVRHLELHPRFYRGEWLLGFGWDQHRFPSPSFPTRFDLDAIFPSTPVAFSRADGHALWVNTKALEVTGLLKPVSEWRLPAGAEAIADDSGLPTGLLIDRAMELIFSVIPQDSLTQKKKDLLEACASYNRAGFTHLRDMSGDESQWQALCELEAEKSLTLYLDQNFTFERAEDFSKALDLSIRARREKHSHLQPRGLKFYIDGALGSEGALLSRPYPGGNSKGLQLWSLEQIQEWTQKAWEQNLEMSVHAIGDEASFLVAQAARQTWEKGVHGVLNLEHAEVVRPETFDLLRGIPTVFHMQPCHWNSDRRWLKEKLGPLYAHVFRWTEARERGFEVIWGSDSPIEKPSLFDNQSALEHSPEAGIPAFPGDWWRPHVHPNPKWGEGCRTVIENGQVVRVDFDDRTVFESTVNSN